MNKIKMKDIAKELALSSKDMLHLLRELGIQVKSQMATLTDEEAAQLRARVRQGSSGRTQVIDTEVSPGVIVRRRKAAPTPPADAAPASRDFEPESPATAVEPVAAAAPAEPEHEEPVEVQYQPQAEDFEAFAEAPAEESAPPAPAPRTGGARIVRPAQTARIIERPEPEKAEEPAPAAVAAEPTAQAPTVAETPAAPVAQDTPPAPETTAQAPETAPEP
ncbi:MAG TPA: translation initiation factor IF-2 N-terminal domain-containing protein, partial [Solidesulfovibrio magneticus]|nr:translation initiation factor IF-2 N-terminal domain-containing protein [Solidesulfovibrio magneticus]